MGNVCLAVVAQIHPRISQLLLVGVIRTFSEGCLLPPSFLIQWWCRVYMFLTSELTTGIPHSRRTSFAWADLGQVACLQVYMLVR